MHTQKRRCSCEEEVLIMMDQLPLPSRRVSVNTTLVQNSCQQVLLDERSYKLATLAVESRGRLGVEGSISVSYTHLTLPTICSV